MANVKKGQLTPAPQWAKHLRPYWKKLFWNREKGAVKKQIRKELKD